MLIREMVTEKEEEVRPAGKGAQWGARHTSSRSSDWVKVRYVCYKSRVFCAQAVFFVSYCSIMLIHASSFGRLSSF
jgi:hypothetical protein